MSSEASATPTGRILRVGLAAGLLMNVVGWIGNQLVLGPLWKDAIQTVVPLRSRTWVNELVSLVPDFMYGIAIAWLYVELARGRGPGLGKAVTAALAVWAVTVVPTYLGIANSGLLPVGLAAATTVVGVVSAIPTAWLVWRWLPRKDLAP
jgi:uncharacterized membrane protein